MAYGPAQRDILPDPVLTNVMIDTSSLGGWLGPLLCGIKAVAKDFVRYGKEDTKSLLSNFFDTFRAPGSRANLLPRPIREWLTATVQEDAVRTEYSEEDVGNSISPQEPRVLAARKLTNVLQFAFEDRVAALFDPAGFASANKTAASAAWSGSGTKILYDVESAKAVLAERFGAEPNYIRIPRKKLPGILSADEIVKNPQGVYAEMMRGVVQGGLPTSFLGMKLIVGTVRRDTTPTGVLTPTFVWDKGNLANTVHIGYSPTLDGGAWDGGTQTFAGCFENQRGIANGSPTAFAANEYLSPYFQEDGVHIVHANVRRSQPQVFNPEAVFAITGI